MTLSVLLEALGMVARHAQVVGVGKASSVLTPRLPRVRLGRHLVGDLEGSCRRGSGMWLGGLGVNRFRRNCVTVRSSDVDGFVGLRLSASSLNRSSADGTKMDMLVQVRAWAKVAMSSTLSPIIKAPIEEESRLDSSAQGRVVSGVGFVGKLSGVIYFEYPQPLAAEITRGMLSMSPTEDPDSQSICDVLGEIANMVVGQVKTRLCEGGMVCGLTLPTVYEGLLREYEVYPEIQMGFLGLRTKANLIRTLVMLRQF